MDKKMVTQLAESFSRSCKSLVKDRPIVRVISSPSIILVSFALLQLIERPEYKSRWTQI